MVNAGFDSYIVLLTGGKPVGPNSFGHPRQWLSADVRINSDLRLFFGCTDFILGTGQQRLDITAMSPENKQAHEYYDAC